MALKRLAVLSLVAVAVAAGVALASPVNCGTMSGGVVNVGICATNSASAGSTSTFTFTLSSSSLNQGDKLFVMLFNNLQSTVGWSSVNNAFATNNFKLQSPNADRSAGTITTTSINTIISGTTSGTGATALTAGAYSYIASPCVGTYTVTINNNGAQNLDYGAYVVIVPADPMPSNSPVLNDGQSSSTASLLPGTSTNAFKWLIGNGFSQGYYPVSTVTVTLTPTAASAGGASSTNSAIWNVALNRYNSVGGATALPSSSVTKTTSSGGVVTFVFKDVSPPSSCTTAYCGAFVQVTAPALTTTNFPSGYDFRTNGVFFDYTVSVSVQEYADLSTQQTGVFDTTATTPTTSVIYQLKVDPLWWRVDISQSITDSNVANSVDGPFTVTVDGYGTTASYYNGVVYNPAFFNPTTQWGVVSGWLAPATYAVTPRLVLTFTRASSCQGAKLSYTLQATATTVPGTCRSYADCAADTNPNADQKSMSANTDPSRFVHCMVSANPNTPVYGSITPYARCVECDPTQDAAATGTGCGAGQYCYADPGLCSFGGQAGQSTWLCDPWAAAQYGYCTAKSKNVLGATCRVAGTPSVFSTTSYVYNGNVLVSGAEGAGGGTEDAPMVGNGWCGEARFYNNTPINANTGISSRTSIDQQVRVVLWSGYCNDQRVCMECSPVAVPNFATVGTRQCINGRYLDPIAVDFTPRTYTKNAIAGTALGGLFMLVLLQICLCAHIFITHKTGK